MPATGLTCCLLALLSYCPPAEAALCYVQAGPMQLKLRGCHLTASSSLASGSNSLAFHQVTHACCRP